MTSMSEALRSSPLPPPNFQFSIALRLSHCAAFFCLAPFLCIGALAAESNITHQLPITDYSAQIAQAADALRPTLVQIRRDLHMHPELANREERTANVIADKLRALGIDDIRTNVAHHG